MTLYAGRAILFAMVPKIPDDVILPLGMVRDSLQAIDWAYGGLMTHKGTWTFLGTGDVYDGQITAVNFDLNVVHVQLIKNGKAGYAITPTLDLFMRAFTFDEWGNSRRRGQLGPHTLVLPAPPALAPHACTDNRRTYDSGWSRYDYCGVCDKKIT